jgi:hypothetical protein
MLLPRRKHMTRKISSWSRRRDAERVGEAGSALSVVCRPRLNKHVRAAKDEGTLPHVQTRTCKVLLRGAYWQMECNALSRVCSDT